MLGKMNFLNLLDYTIQPSDMDLFQQYMVDNAKQVLLGSRTPGFIFGGQLTVVAGMQLKLSAGLALFPDGQLVQFPDLTTTLGAADPTNPRYDRIELQYAPLNNTQVVDVNSQTKTLDILFNTTINVIVGTPVVSPTVPVKTSANISAGFVLVPAAAGSIVSGNINQIVDNGFETSAIQLGNKNSFIRFNQTLTQLQFSNGGGLWAAFGSGGGGGGGGANWQAVDGLSPEEEFEFNERAFAFAKGEGQTLALWAKVPTGYLAGTQVKMKLAHYSPSTSGNWQFSVVATLIRKNQDAVSSTANQYTSTNSFTTQSVANQYKEVVYDVTNASGLINGLALTAGDLILIKIQRITPVSGTEDTADVRMIPSSTEVLFS